MPGKNLQKFLENGKIIISGSAHWVRHKIPTFRSYTRTQKKMVHNDLLTLEGDQSLAFCAESGLVSC